MHCQQRALKQRVVPTLLQSLTQNANLKEQQYTPTASLSDADYSFPT